MKKNIIIIFVACLFLITGCTNNQKFLEEYTLDKDSLPKNYLNAYNVKITEEKITSSNYSYYIEKEGVKFPNIDNDYSLYKDVSSTTSIYKNSKSEFIAFQLFTNEPGQSINYQNIKEDEKINSIKEKYPNLSLEAILEKDNLNIQNDIDVIYFIVKNNDLKVTNKSSKEDIIKRYYVDLLTPIYIPKTENLNFYTGDQYGYTIRQEKRIIVCLSKNDNQEIRFLMDFNTEQEAINYLTEVSDFVSKIIIK